jgi:DNA-binding PadR family transcriptional regulator
LRNLGTARDVAGMLSRVEGSALEVSSTVHTAIEVTKAEAGAAGRVAVGRVAAAEGVLLTDQPMHGYQIMQAMSDRTGGAWQPSPGAIYPTIAQLEDEGLVTTREEGGRRSVTLTPEGRAYVEERSARLGDPFAVFANAPNRPDLRDPLHQLHAAVRQIEVGGDAAQLEAAAQTLAQARRSLYLILAGEGEDGTTE